jgi:hypothetical protein
MLQRIGGVFLRISPLLAVCVGQLRNLAGVGS